VNCADQGAQHSAGSELQFGDYLKFVVIGLCLFAGMATQQVGLLTTSVTNSGFLTGLYVVFTPVLGVLLYRSTPHPVTWVAALLSLVGIYFLSGGALGQLVKGDILTIFSAMFWGFQVVLIARFVGETGRPLALSQIQFMITALLALLVALVLEPIEWGGILEAAPQILYAGIFASGFAFTIQVIGQRYTNAPQAAIFLSAEAPFAALFAFIFLNEKISTIGFVGCAFILAAMLTVEFVPQWQAHRIKRTAEI
jgi:drug/metabolite transporter (DMT)-like permease